MNTFFWMVVDTLLYNARQLWGWVVAVDPTRTRKSERDSGDYQEAGTRVLVLMHQCLTSPQPRGSVMTRIHQRVSSRKNEWRHQFSFRCARSAQHAIWIFAVMAFLASMVMAQSSSQLNGSVQDPSGASVANANITLTDTATGFQRKTTSNASGLYQFLDLPAGEYRLEVTATGFAKIVVPNVTIQVKLPSTVPLRWQVAGETTSVNSKAKHHSSTAQTHRSATLSVEIRSRNCRLRSATWFSC